ncbi:MAG TPA: SIMPL domain-containing protein [Chloroflexota bacterium]|nr:SIMPL domain-containing protein [Chloroflexota bacterium]
MNTKHILGGSALALCAIGALALPPALQLRPHTATAQSIGGGQMELAQTVSVSGEGEASTAPDVAFINLAVQAEASTAREAIDKNSASMAAVIDALRRIGIPDRSLRTSGLSLNAVRGRQRPEDTQPPPITGYQATNSLNVTVEPVTKAGETLDVAVSAGANIAGGIRFAVNDNADLQNRALDGAVKSARVRADTIAAAAGLRVTGVRSISEDGGQGMPVARAELQSADARGGAVVPPVQPGELTLRARVRVIYTFG